MAIRQYSRQHGFSLLELMCVIAVLAALSVVGVSAYRGHMQRQRLSHTALQIQQLMQAAMAYHVDEGKWPTAIDTPAFKSYMPQGRVPTNAWGYAYQLAYPNHIRLGVRTVLPTESLAKQLAAQLPNARVTAHDVLWQVQAEMTVPGQSSAFNSGLRVLRFAQLSGLHDGDERQVRDLSCDGHLSIMTSITGFYPQIENFTGGDPIARLAVNSHCGERSCALQVLNQEEINLHQPEANGTVNVQYLVLCSLRHHD